jgi:hypothetical protein
MKQAAPRDAACFFLPAGALQEQLSLPEDDSGFFYLYIR